MEKAEVTRRLEAFNARVALKRGRKDFVGAVYDAASDDDGDAVALIVGINYGQIDTSNAFDNPQARTGYALEERVGYAHHAAALAHCKSIHTVLWNFHPYLTKREWLKEARNSAVEAGLLFDAGYEDMFAAFEELVRLLDPQLILFHGVSSSVPILARVALRQVGWPGPAFIAPNLSRIGKRLKEEQVELIA